MAPQPPGGSAVNPILALLLVSLFVGVRSHKTGQPISYRVLLGASLLCVAAFYSQRFI